MTRRQLIVWAALAVGDDCHVVPVSNLRNGNQRKRIQRKHLLGHTTEGWCWCKPARAIRRDGSLLYTHDDLPN